MGKSKNLADLGSHDVIDTHSTGMTVTGTVTSDGLTVDGNVGIGTSSPSRLLSIDSGATSNGRIHFTNTATGSGTSNGFFVGQDSADGKVSLWSFENEYMRFATNNTEAMRIDSSGNLLVGKTASDFNTQGFEINSGGQLRNSRASGSVAFLNRKTDDGSIVDFGKDGTVMGSVSVTSSGTTYNTTSDKRLKDNIEPIADGTAKLMAMKPVTHTWIADPEADAVVGFIAQEMQEIVPEAVSGDPDGEEMMSMDYGRITPVLVAALQEATNEIKALKQRVSELEAS